jgi:hypothetical protein
MKKSLRLFAALLVFACTFAVMQNSSAATEICKGSGEHCMDVDMGNGMTAKFVKTKGSPAVVIQ